jgi:hypothetical protein
MVKIDMKKLDNWLLENADIDADERECVLERLNEYISTKGRLKKVI